MTHRILLPIALCVISVLTCPDANAQITIFSENFDGTVQPYTAGGSYTSANCSNQMVSSTASSTCALAYALTPISKDASGSGKFLFEGTSILGSYQSSFYSITLATQEWFTGYAFTISFKVALADNIISPSLQPMINGSAVGTPITPTAINSWQTLSFVYTPSSNLISPVFSLYNNQSTSVGNDFGIDEIKITVLTMDALPLSHFLNFSAMPEKQGVLVKWSEPALDDSYHFVVERSTDSEHYDSIGTLTGIASGTSLQQYLFNDMFPAEGINFYRVRLNRAEGLNYYSTIVKVKWERFSLAFNIFPMPAKKQFTISLQKPDNAFYNVSLIDVSGKIFYNATIAIINNQLPVSLPAYMTPGLYFVKISSSNESFFGKIILR